MKPSRGRRMPGGRWAAVVSLFATGALALGAGSVLAGAGSHSAARRNLDVPRARQAVGVSPAGAVIVGHSYKNDRSRPLRLMP